MYSLSATGIFYNGLAFSVQNLIEQVGRIKSGLQK